ncbi:hypothetical protein DID76_00195 [Candidatus Marinamargulisbacteria bacterium SCGC AG-414-C22]|nr:hypothetical protein DID76_00195 [Candidatus Marinamargulisbacteria bacterium SCGC AG-414-C22]
MLSAHPVTYKDGYSFTTILGKNTHIYANYSYAAQKAVGVSFEQLDSRDPTKFYMLKHNSRLYRNNMFDAQSNIYHSIALMYESSSDSLNPCYHIMADYENRQYYTSGSFEYMPIQSTSFVRSKIRIGVAPYKHSYTGISTWFMLELKTINYIQNSTVLVPVYRGFFKHYLWELGLDRDYLSLTFMIHM